MKITFEILDKDTHNRDDFDCGSEGLNSFLNKQANQRQKRHNAVTHVAVDADSRVIPKTIYGYYTLSNYCVEFNRLPPADARNKLYSNSGFGEIILMEVFRKALSLSAEVGIYLIDVDILNEKVGKFYKKYGFKEFIDENKHMFITIETIKKLFNRVV